MSYDWNKDFEASHRLAIERQVNRPMKEKGREDESIVKSPLSAANMDTTEYVDELDIPGTMDDGMARLLYIVVMVVGVIFNDRWLIWIGATIVYLRHVFRRKIHKVEWENKHKNK